MCSLVWLCPPCSHTQFFHDIVYLLVCCMLVWWFVLLCDELGKGSWCPYMTTLVLGGNLTTGRFVVEVTIFWDLVVVAALPFFVVSPVLCVLVSSFFTIVCPWIMGIVLLFHAAHLSWIIVPVLLSASMRYHSWLILFSWMLDFVSLLSTLDKCIVASMMAFYFADCLHHYIVMFGEHCIRNLHASYFFHPHFIAPVMFSWCFDV